MTKAELVTQVALKTELTKQQTAEVVDLLLECIIKALQAGDKVELRGFGSFRRRDRRPRLGQKETPPVDSWVELHKGTKPAMKKSCCSSCSPALFEPVV
jgi:integration host factor subunit beta